MGRTEVREAVLQALPPQKDMRLLDIGCGHGGLLDFLLRRNPETNAVGVERDPRRAAAARRSTWASVVRGDGRRLPFDSDTMDIVVLAKSLHHMAPGTREKTLQESQRVLRPGGQLIVLEKTAPRTLLERVGLYIQVALGGEDGQVYSLFGEGLTKELEQAAFEVVADRSVNRTRLALAKAQSR